MQNVCKFKPQYIELWPLKVRWGDLFLGGRLNICGMSKEREWEGGGGIFNFLHVGGIDLLWNGPII